MHHLGAINTLSASIEEAEQQHPGIIPDLRQMPTLLLGSNYSGPQRQAPGQDLAAGEPRNLAFGDRDLRTLYMVGNSIFKVPAGNARRATVLNCIRDPMTSTFWRRPFSLSSPSRFAPQHRLYACFMVSRAHPRNRYLGGGPAVHSARSPRFGGGTDDECGSGARRVAGEPASRAPLRVRKYE